MDDLTDEAVRRALAGRPARVYPAVLSTHADGLAWARGGAPTGAVVVADYQASPRGRAGVPWQVRPGADLGFSLVLRPRLSAEREGWLYVAATTGLADALGGELELAWPDTVERAGEVVAMVGVETDPAALAWAVVSVLVPGVGGRRALLLARAVRAVEARVAAPVAGVLDRYRSRCRTFGRRVCARLMPLGPAGRTVTGVAEDVGLDGALLVRTDRGVRLGVRPRHLATITLD